MLKVEELSKSFRTEEIETIASSSMVKFFIETSDPEAKVSVESWMRLP